MNNVNTIFKQLEPLSLFELGRLQYAMAKLLDDPERNEAIKRQLKIGMRIAYFSGDRNDLVEATISQIKKTWVSVVNVKDGAQWRVKFCLINLQGIDVNIASKKLSGGLNRNSLKLGDRVGWHSRQGYELYGIVEKLNPKKALIQLSDGQRWMVPYALLFLITEGVAVQGGHLCIEGEVIHAHSSVTLLEEDIEYPGDTSTQS